MSSHKPKDCRFDFHSGYMPGFWVQSLVRTHTEDSQLMFLSLFFLRFYYLFIFREGKGGREGEKHQCVVASHAPLVGNLACNPGMYPDWELNWQPFGSQADAQSTEPHQPGMMTLFKCTYSCTASLIKPNRCISAYSHLFPGYLLRCFY